MDRLAPYQLGAVATATAAVVAIAVLSWGRPAEADHTLVVAAWVAGLLAVVVAAGARPPHVDPRRLRPDRYGLLAVATVAIAFVLRVVQLDRFPRLIDADGMGFALYARAIADGQLRDPFASGYLQHPMLWSYGQRAVMAVTGETLAGARSLSALVGTAAVAATITWGRRIGGWTVGLLAGALLAASPMHLQFSRLAINNISDSLALPLTLFLLDRGLVDHRRTSAVGAGIALGLAQYGYLGARTIIPIVGLTTLVLLARAHRRDELASAARLVGWVAMGGAVAVAPIAVHYLEHPADLTGRDAQVSIFAGWLDEEMERTGDSELRVLAEQGVRAALIPMLDGQSSYHPPAPLVGWPLLLTSAVGLGVLLGSWRRRHAAALLVAWIVPLAAIATTVGLFSHRWVIGTPVVAVTAALGLTALGGVVRAAVPSLREGHVVPATGIALVLVTGAVHATGFYRESNAVTQHGDVNSFVATELADQLLAEPPGTQVYVAFTPRMGFRSHATIPFLVPHVDGYDLVEPITHPDTVPAAPPGTTFAFLPERLRELDVVRERYPGGTEQTVSAFGEPLYTSYQVVARP